MRPSPAEALSAPLRLAAVLLAAGSASRMGYKPKALLELDGQALILRQLAALKAAGIGQTVVVLGHHIEQIEPLVRDLPVTRVRHPEPDQGQVSSLRLGLKALGGPLDAVMVVLVDQPLIGADELIALRGAYKNRPAGAQVVVPTVDDLPGNPVIFDAEVMRSILAGPPAFGCKQWQAKHPAAVYHWPTDNRRYRQDVDSPEDIARLAQQTGHCLHWPADLR